MAAPPSRANREAQRGSPPRMMAYRRLPVFFALGAVLGWQMWLRAPHPWTWLQAVGLGMVVVGFCFWLVAHIQLGASFSVKAEARALVTRGLYSKIRNPIYVFGSIGIAGVALYWNMPQFLLAFLFLIPLQAWRAQKEARVLEDKFGEEYRAYRRQTWF